VTSAPDQLHRNLDLLVQEVTALKTGKTKRVPVLARPMRIGEQWDHVLSNESEACISELKTKNTRTAARTARGYRTIRKAMK
jgi:hypothetical protein